MNVYATFLIFTQRYNAGRNWSGIFRKFFGMHRMSSAKIVSSLLDIFLQMIDYVFAWFSIDTTQIFSQSSRNISRHFDETRCKNRHEDIEFLCIIYLSESKETAVSLFGIFASSFVFRFPDFDARVWRKTKIGSKQEKVKAELKFMLFSCYSIQENR